MLFKSARPDGRSHGDVLLTFLRGGEPGRLYTYDELAIALTYGDVVPARDVVQRVVAQNYLRLLRDEQRALRCVKGQGYRLACANEHMELATTRKHRADVQFRKGLHTLRHVKWDELDANTRAAHEGHLMITEALYRQQAALDRRLRAVEIAVSGLRP